MNKEEFANISLETISFAQCLAFIRRNLFYIFLVSFCFGLIGLSIGAYQAHYIVVGNISAKYELPQVVNNSDQYEENFRRAMLDPLLVSSFSHDFLDQLRQLNDGSSKEILEKFEKYLPVEAVETADVASRLTTQLMKSSQMPAGQSLDNSSLSVAINYSPAGYYSMRILNKDPFQGKAIYIATSYALERFIEKYNDKQRSRAIWQFEKIKEDARQSYFSLKQEYLDISPDYQQAKINYVSSLNKIEAAIRKLEGISNTRERSFTFIPILGSEIDLSQSSASNVDDIIRERTLNERVNYLQNTATVETAKVDLLYSELAKLQGLRSELSFQEALHKITFKSSEDNLARSIGLIGLMSPNSFPHLPEMQNSFQEIKSADSLGIMETRVNKTALVFTIMFFLGTVFGTVLMASIDLLRLNFTTNK